MDHEKFFPFSILFPSCSYKLAFVGLHLFWGKQSAFEPGGLPVGEKPTVLLLGWILLIVDEYSRGCTHLC